MKPSEISARIRASLSPNILRVVDALGWEASLHFLRKHGGKHVYIPKRYSANHPVLRDLTEEQRHKLIAAFFDCEKDCFLPGVHKMLSRERYELILLDLNNGYTQRMVAAKYNCSPAEVHRIVQHFGGVK